MTLEEKVLEAKVMIKRSIEFAEEELESDREQVLRVAERSTADEIISWANNMRNTEQRIAKLREQLKVIEYLEK